MARILLCVGLVVVAASLCGQEAETPEFPIETGLVVLDLVVRDADGQPVTDLRPGEVEVLEGGLPCLIESFRLVSPGSSSPVEEGTAEEENGISPATEAVSADSGLSQNPLRPNVVILVFDRLGVEAAGTARQAATDFARREFPDETWFAVYEIGDSVQVRQRLTSHPAALLAAIEQATTGGDRSRPAASTPDHDTLTKEALRAVLIASADPAPTRGAGVNPSARIQTSFDQARAQMGRLADSMEQQRLGQTALRALLAVSRELAGVKGRKTLLLFSEGLYVPGGLADVLGTLVSEANRSNLAIYGIDPRGLLTEGQFEESRMALLAARSASEKRQRVEDPESLGAKGEMFLTPEEDQSASTTETQMHDIAEDALRMNTQANLRDLAEATGGFLLANTNDLSIGIERIGADLRSYYEIGYTPPVPFADGRFRNIQVHVARSDVRVRTRKGYFARPPSEEPALEAWELTLAQSFELATPPRDFGHRVSAQVAAATPEGSEVQVTLRVPLRGLHFEYDQDAKRYRAHFSVLVLVRETRRGRRHPSEPRLAPRGAPHGGPGGPQPVGHCQAGAGAAAGGVHPGKRCGGPPGRRDQRGADSVRS